MRTRLFCTLLLVAATPLAGAAGAAPTAQPSPTPIAAAAPVGVATPRAIAAPEPMAAPTQPTPTSIVASVAPARPPVPATTGEVLQIAKLALDDAHKHGEHSIELLKLFGGVVLGVFSATLGLFGFFGLREFKSITKPVREKAESLTQEMADLKAIHQTEIENLTKSFGDWQTTTKEAFKKAADEHMAAINEDLLAEKAAQQSAMKELTAQIFAQSELNGKAQVIASTIWEYIAKAKMETHEMEEVVRLVKSVITDDDASKLDPFLQGVLLIRMAYAQKRLGDVRGAFESAKRAVDLNPGDPRNSWLRNAACYAALIEEFMQCKHYVALAVSRDVAAKTKLAADPDLDNVKGESWFQELVA